MSKLLVVDDEQSICWGLKRLGESMGHEVEASSSVEHAFQQIETFSPDAIVLDVRLPGMDGLTAIKEFHERVGQVPIIIITAYGDLKTAVKAVRSGAFEYIVKPFDIELVQRVLTRAIHREPSEVGGHIPTNNSVGDFVGSSNAMQEVFKHLALAAASEASVLICGESGTGKELAARAIHQYSNSAEGPFVAVNIASLSESVVESELFGHVRGAFTGAEQDRVGLLVQADGGTLFLDEVADIPMPTQVKLLRALDHGEVIPVGASSPIKTTFRVVSASHQDLLEHVSNGLFRHDLYFRLGTYRIDIPPLRERKEDIQELANFFLHSLHRENSSIPRLSHSALEELESRPWYGNVRELRNAIEHAVIVSRGQRIESDHLPEAIAASMLDVQDHQPSLETSINSVIERWAEAKLGDSQETENIYDQLLQLIERPLMKAAIEKHHGQCAAAARRLGMHRTTLRKKLDEYGLGDG